jgi:hypothetical protein
MINEWETEARKWAEDVFSASTLPDERLCDRLVAYAAAQAVEPSASTARACKGDRAAREGAYRFLENNRVAAADIDEGPFQHTADLCLNRQRVLAVQDTSSVSVASLILRDDLKNLGGPTGFLAHSTLMVDGITGAVIGLSDQLRWIRTNKKVAARNADTTYATRESSKWEMSDRNMSRRLHDMRNVILVADREADLYEFLSYLDDQQRRFVVRAQTNRKTPEDLLGIFDQVSAAAVMGHRDIVVEQRGAVPKTAIESGRSGRKRRVVKTALQAIHVEIEVPARLKSSGAHKILKVNVVRVSALDKHEEKLEWFLLTREPVDTCAEIEQVVQDYEHRWVIEEFHKCWKTGTRLEKRPLESLGAVERMMSITAPIAVRLLQLATSARSPVIDKSTPAILTNEEFWCLWALTEHTTAPTAAPSTCWALYAVARLGGWYNSKRTGRVGWDTLWRGWEIFQNNLVGWRAARRIGKM